MRRAGHPDSASTCKEDAMKKRPKKLTLSRDTVMGLELQQRVVGGGTRTVYPFPCPYSGENTCETCAGVCTSNYC